MSKRQSRPRVRGRSIRMLLAVVACALPLKSPAQPLTVGAQPLGEKACILAVAQKLPAIPGLEVMSGSAQSLPQEDAAKRLVSTFGSTEDSVAALNGTFGFLDAKLREAVQYQYSGGGRDQVKADIITALRRQIIGAHTVEISIKAAGIEAVYGSTCASSSSGRYVTTPTIVR